MNVSLPLCDIHSQTRDAGYVGSCASPSLTEILSVSAIAQQRSHNVAFGFQAGMAYVNSPTFLDMEIYAAAFKDYTFPEILYLKVEMA